MNVKSDGCFRYCPPSQECQASRAMRGICDPQGVLEPVVCEGGHYCPEGGKRKIPCEKGR
jgi:hypothetical protein